MQLYNFHRSSASFRVRIALALKGLPYEYVPVRLGREQGDQDSDWYGEFNPQRKVPVLVDGPTRISQSVAILEYLEALWPAPPLLPADEAGRARVRSITQYVACEIQPLNNLSVERHLARELGLDETQLRAWRRHWISRGFDALETDLAGSSVTGVYCHGDVPTMADCFVVPQLFNAQRPVVGLQLDPWPTLKRIWDTCLAHPAFEGALPRHQPDWVEDL